MNGNLLDTNVVINFIKGIDSAQKVIAEIKNDCCVSSITLGELMFGAKKSKLSEFNKNKYISFCNFVGTLEIDFNVAQVYGDIKHQLSEEGKLIPENDIWISAVALSKGLTLISYDKHFQNVKGLDFKFVETT